MTPRREAVVFWCAVAALWLLFLVQAWNTPILLDDWYQLPWHKSHAFGPSSIWQYFAYNYFHFNPRLGDVILMIVNGPSAFHLVLTPLVEVGLLWVGFAVTFGRWPRATLRDLQLLLFVQVMIWIVIPIPGIIYFYRPFATNYLWAFGITLSLFIPYRFALALPLPDPRKRLWLAPLMFVLGWLAGMCNEHTGPTAMVALAGFVYWAWKQQRLRAWMVSGLAGLWIGYPMLFLAPGQHLRYAGMATRNTPLHLLGERGFAGCLDILIDFVGEAEVGLALFAVAVALYLAAHRKRGERVPVLPRQSVLMVIALVLGAGSIVVTLFASPTVGERLFFAPSILLVFAFAAIAEHLFDEPIVRRVITGICIAAFGYHAFRFVVTYAAAKQENDDRIAQLRAAPQDTVAVIAPYKLRQHSRWFWGDDLRYASLREYVANEVFDLKNITFDRELTWAEPTPKDHFVATRTYEPVLAPEIAATIAPVRYVPSYWEWTLVQFRRMMAMHGLGRYEDHLLVRYTVDDVDLDFKDPLKRPVRVLDWTPTTLTFIDGRPYDDTLGRPFVRVWQDSVPKQLTESYVLGCGVQRLVQLVPDVDDHIGPMLPVTLECRGTYTAIMCEPDVCWLAGRYWR